MSEVDQLAVPSASIPALFLDRDGVVNIEKAYVHNISDFEFIEGIFPLCRTAMACGLMIFIITNQAGIGRGYYSEAQYNTLMEWMLGHFERNNVIISRVYHCPFHPVHGLGPYKMDSFDRKPHPGMILQAKADFNLDLFKSILIGDKESDIAAGNSAGIGTNLLFQGPPEISNATARISTLHDAEKFMVCLKIA